MVTLSTAIYLGGWMLITVAALTADLAVPHGNRMRPNPKTFGVLSVAAGALWPLLAIGVVEFGSVMVAAKLHRT